MKFTVRPFRALYHIFLFGVIIYNWGWLPAILAFAAAVDISSVKK